MKNIFLYPFAKDFCPKCNNRLRKIKQESASYKEAFAACKKCNLTLNIICKNNNIDCVPITIKYMEYRFKIYEDCELYIFKETKGFLPEIVWQENKNSCNLTNIKDFFNYCNKITDNLLFL